MDLSHPRPACGISVCPVGRGFTSLLSALSGVGVLRVSSCALPSATEWLPEPMAVPKPFLWSSMLVPGDDASQLWLECYLVCLEWGSLPKLPWKRPGKEELDDSTVCNTLCSICNVEFPKVILFMLENTQTSKPKRDDALWEFPVQTILI